MSIETKTHGDYTVGWICALPKEQTAATAMLDKRHGNLTKPPHDSNTYTLGSIGQHNVAIACLPKGKIGTNSAANVVTLMIGTFPSIKIGLVVGIGGGIPPKVRLGDVVVSAPVGRFPGAVQWDMGKAKQGGKFERTGALNNIPNALLSALGKLETAHELSGSKIPEYFDVLKQEYPKAAKKYLKSDSLQDVLFRAEYNHVNEASADDDTLVEDKADDEEEEEEDAEEDCRFCNKAMIVKRKPRDMRVHYGLIASGNQVIKDATFRDKLNKDLGGSVLCIEMEAAGLMNNFPCLVIRGICDYSDSHKNKSWQEHAAAVAAAFAKELLGYVQTSDIKGERLVKDALNKIQHVQKKVEDGFKETINYLSNLRKDNELRNEIQTQKDILNWLSHVDFAPQQNDYITRCEPGTGQSLLDSTEFHAWLMASKQTLFCPGIPGAGKTIQTSILVNYLIDRFEYDTTVGIAYLYCSFQRQQDQTVEYLLANLIKQLARNQKPFPSSVQTLYDRHQIRNTRPVLEELLATLQSVVMSYSRVFIAVDALDECHYTDHSRTKILDQLLSAQSKTGLNIFATSRFIPDIKMKFEGCLTREIRPSHEDISTFLAKRMSQLPDFVADDIGLQNEIKTEIESAIEGMFLLAQLYVDSLVGKRSSAVLRLALKGLRNASSVSPDGSSALDEAYKKAMERIQHQRGDLPRDALLILSWIVNARRQLTVLELQDALAVEIGKSTLDKDNIPTVEHITGACAPLVVVDENSNIVRLVHYTTQEYFEKTKNIRFKNAQIDITKICLTYLSLSAFESGFCTSQDELKDRLNTNNFYKYAAQNWGHHAREALTLGWEALEVVYFLECEAKREASSQALIGPERRYSYHGDQRIHIQLVLRQVTALHLAGYFGLYDVVILLLARGHNPNAMDARGLTPLWWAIRMGHVQVVEVLLKENVDLDLQDTEYNLTPLLWAAKWDPENLTPLTWAARNGHVDVVDLLLEKGADLEAKSNSPRKAEVRLLMGNITEIRNYLRRETPLIWAARSGNKAVVKLLLAKDANLEAKDNDGLTPLFQATRNKHEAVVKLLLAKGATLEDKDRDGLTPLACAIKEGYKTIVELLLAKGANLEDKNKHGLTPLAWAAREGDEVMVKLLLHSRADFNAQDNIGMTVLHWAAWKAAQNGHEGIVSLLLASDKVDADMKDRDGRTPISYAAQNGNWVIVKALLATRNVDADSKCNSGRTPLSYAAERGCLPAVQLLAGSGKVDLDSKDDEGRTPLSYACHVAIIEFLLDSNKVDIESRDNISRTPLWHALDRRQVVVAQSLLEHGAVRDPKNEFQAPYWRAGARWRVKKM